MSSTLVDLSAPRHGHANIAEQPKLVARALPFEEPLHTCVTGRTADLSEQLAALHVRILSPGTYLGLISWAARTEGVITDPVYEGESMAGLIGMVRAGEIPAGSRVLYAHLGGQPALSAYAHTPGLGG